MPWFSLHRTHTLSTTTGHVVNFIKGAVTWVPDVAVPFAIAIGAVPTVPLTAELDPLPPDAPPPAPPLTLEQRQAKYFEAFDALVLRARRDDFLASGLPHIKKVEEISELQVSAAERDEMWQKYQDSRAESSNA